MCLIYPLVTPIYIYACSSTTQAHCVTSRLHFGVPNHCALCTVHMLLIFNMVWPWFSCGTVCVCPQFPYRGSDTIFWTFLIVPCHAFCMWHWPICKDLDLNFIWGHHHLHIVGLWISVEQLNTSQLATPCWRDPTRSKQLSTVAIWLSVWTLSCRISLASLFTSLSIFGWYQIFYRSYVNRQHFRLRSFASFQLTRRPFGHGNLHFLHAAHCVTSRLHFGVPNHCPL